MKAFELQQHVLNFWNRIQFTFDTFIQLSKVVDKLNRSIFLRDDEQGCSPLTVVDSFKNSDVTGVLSPLGGFSCALWALEMVLHDKEWRSP